MINSVFYTLLFLNTVLNDIFWVFFRLLSTPLVKELLLEYLRIFKIKEVTKFTNVGQCPMS